MGKSLLADVQDSVCVRRRCLVSRGGSSIDLDQLVDLGATNSPHEICERAGGGQSDYTAGGSSARNSTPLVSFIFTLHNNPIMATTSILDAFRVAHETESAEFVILDDASDADMGPVYKLCAKLKDLFGTRIALLRNKKSAGYGASNNAALAYARGEYALLLNSDLSLLPGALSMLLRTMEKYPRAGMVGPLMLSPSGHVMEAGGHVFRYAKVATFGRNSLPSDLTMQHARPVDYISAACLLIRRKLFSELGLFDKQFEPAYYEDTDAALTHLRAGYYTVLQPLALAVHAEGKSYPNEEKTKLMEVRQKRFHKKHRDIVDAYCPELAPTCPSVTSMEAISYSFMARQRNHVLMLESHIPEPDNDLESVRLAEIVRLIIDMGYFVTFEALPSSAGRNVRYVLSLLADGVNVLPPGSLRDMVNRAFPPETGSATFIPSPKRCPWDVVWIGGFDVFFYHIEDLKKVCPEVPIIYDTVDLRFWRERQAFELELRGRQFSHGEDGLVALTQKELDDTEAMELSYVKMSNVALVGGQEERRLLTKMVPDSVPVLFPSNIYQSVNESIDDPSTRRGGIFAADACDRWSRIAVAFIVKEVLNEDFVASHKDFTLHIVWSNSRRCGDSVGEQFWNHPLVEVHRDGTSERSIILHKNVRMLLVPPQVSGSFRADVGLAMLQGLPVIGPRAAIKGMFLVDGESALLAETAADYRAAIDRVSGSLALFNSLRRGGWDVMRRHFSPDAARRTLRDLFFKIGVALPDMAGSLARNCGKVGLDIDMPEECSDCWHCVHNPAYFPPPMLPYTDTRYFGIEPAFR